MKKYLFLALFFPLICFGQYCDTITNGVQNADTVIVCVDSVSCFGYNDGRIVIDVRPSSGYYRYNWDSIPQLGVNIQDNLIAGTPGVSITDTNNNPILYIDIPIYEPSQINNWFSITKPLCHADSNGSVQIITNGGTPPFTYNWSTGLDETGLNTTLNNVPSGEYILITQDHHLCSDTTPYDVDETPKVNSETISDTLSCIGLCDGSGIVTPSDGVAPYTYSWSNGDVDSITVTGLCYGLDTVYITDANGCLDTNWVDIANPDTLQLSNITIDSACYQACDGELSVTIEGGTSPYDTEWSLGGNIFDTINTTTEDTLCPGNYQLIFTDLLGCSDSVLISLAERDSFRLAPPSIIHDSCFQTCKGQITVEVLNQENPPFNYYWNQAQGDSVISNCCSDTFELIIMDQRLCTDTFEFFVDQEDSMYFDVITVEHDSCYGDEEGVISISNINGGVGAYTYAWTGPGGPYTTQDLSGLAAGAYTVIVTDAYSCSIDSNIVVNEPNELYVASSAPENVSCFGASDGIIEIHIFGGTGNYFISWDIVIPDTNYIDSLPAGDYIYTIVDTGTTCPPLEDTLAIDEPLELEIIDSLIINVLCHGDSTGEIHLTVTGGTSPYEYSIDNGVTYQPQDYFNNLSAGSYTVIVRDINGCLLNSPPYNITEPSTVLAAGLTASNLLCFSDTGSIILTVNGGTPNYSFFWNNGAITQNLNGVGAGNYSVTILDGNSCEVIKDTTVTEPFEIILTDIITDLDCFEDGTGAISITTNGGTSPYDFLWDSGDTTEDLSGLSAGNYELFITDANLCPPYNESFLVEQPDLFETDVMGVTHIDCFGNDNGSIDLQVTGGTSNFTYDWDSGQTTSIINNLSPGIYIVTAKDANQCQFTDQAEILEPDELILSLISITHVECEGEATGELYIDVTGGVGGYSCSWNNGSSTSNPDLLDVIAGNYDLYIEDANGCKISDSYFIDQPSPYNETVNVIDIITLNGCYGDAIGSIDFSIVGNTPPYSYVWSNNETTASISDLLAETYDISVLDFNNCTTFYTYTITQPPLLEILLDKEDASCEEKDDGRVWFSSINYGTPPYSYIWTIPNINLGSTQEIDYLSPGTYFLEVTDANNCFASESIAVGIKDATDCLEIPTGFTPNGDGIHDKWKISGLKKQFPDAVVQVYNRWGQEVFISKAEEVYWDGKYNGVDLPTAAYYYVIELNESDKVVNGTVTIKR